EPMVEVAMTLPLLSEARSELLVAESLMRLNALRPVNVLLSPRRVEDAEPPPVVRHVPFTAKQPFVMFTPLLIVVEPVLETVNKFVVPPPVEEAMMNALLKNELSPLLSEIATLPNGEVVPTPTFPPFTRASVEWAEPTPRRRFRDVLGCLMIAEPDDASLKNWVEVPALPSSRSSLVRPIPKNAKAVVLPLNIRASESVLLPLISRSTAEFGAVPIPTLPVFVTAKSVDVAVAVEEEMINRFLPGRTAPLLAESARSPNGVVVPMPIAPEVGSLKAEEVAGSVPKKRFPILSCWLPVELAKNTLFPMPMFSEPDESGFSVSEAPIRILRAPERIWSPDWYPKSVLKSPPSLSCAPALKPT